jgi:hypothetical protein
VSGIGPRLDFTTTSLRSHGTATIEAATGGNDTVYLPVTSFSSPQPSASASSGLLAADASTGAEATVHVQHEWLGEFVAGDAYASALHWAAYSDGSRGGTCTCAWIAGDESGTTLFFVYGGAALDGFPASVDGVDATLPWPGT